MKYILAIESSCDETGAALFSPDGELVRMQLATQPIHAAYGGVVPELASRAHMGNMIPVIDSLFAKSDLSVQDVDRIAVTQGPGLLGALLVGVQFAKGLAMRHQWPIYGVHHIRAHLMANFIEPPHPTFPFLGLVVSGGHTQLIYAKNLFEMELIGTTCDDAIGEAFDKIAKLMGYPYPGGKYIDELAQQGDPRSFVWPRSRVKGLNFSFSGIKTAVMYRLQKEKFNRSFISDHAIHLAASIQYTLVEMIVDKVVAALDLCAPLPLVVGGGVASNSELRKRLFDLMEARGGKLFIPPPLFCTDNAAMIGVTAHYTAKFGRQGVSCDQLDACPRMAL